MPSSIERIAKAGRTGRRLAVAAVGVVAFLGFPALVARAQPEWFPVPIEVWDPPFKKDSPRKNESYRPLDAATKVWRVCVSIPHLKDSYWLGVNFGVAAEAKRLGIKLELFEAGGYDYLSNQIDQIRRCLANGANGLIVGAISAYEMGEALVDATARKVPVVDLVNGIEDARISARSAVSFSDMGFMAGKHLVQLAEKEGRDFRVAWFPGPKGAGWVAAGDEGFRSALKGSRVGIVSAGFGDTGLQRQESLIMSALVENQGIDFIVGTAVTAEAAVEVLRRQKFDRKIRVMAYYYSPGVHRGIRRGTIVAAPTDMQVIQGRIAVDQAVRILENKPLLKHVGPKIRVIERSSLKDFDVDTTLPPAGFHPVMSVN